MGFCEQAIRAYLRVAQKLLHFSVALKQSFSSLGKHMGAKNHPIGIKISASEPIGKQLGPQRNLVDISPINVVSPICFHLNKMGKATMTYRLKRIFKNQQRFLFLTITSYFCQNILILSSDSVSLSFRSVAE
jgi:hypothetical protein